MIIINEDMRKKELLSNKNELNKLSICLEINVNDNNNSINRFKLTDISSDYILRNIFSFIKYNDIIKLVKYNKKLQSKLNLDINNYICGYEKRTIYYGLPPHVDNGWGDGFYAISLIPILIPHIIFFIIYSLIIFIPEINLNEAFKGSHWNIINNLIINILFIVLNIVSIFVISHAAIFVYSDYKIRKLIYMTLIILCFGGHCAYEILTIIRIVQIIFHAINRKWLILFDILFLVGNFSYLYFYFRVFIDYKEGNSYKSKETKIFLVSYKNVRIDEYVLPDDFLELNNKRYYISKIAYQLKVDYSQSDYKLIDLINNFRIKNKLNELEIDYKLPRFILDDSTEILLSSLNVIKLSNDAYVFRFKKKIDFDFDTDSFMEDKNNTKILLNENLNRINIIQQGKIKYILVYGYFEDNKDIDIEIKGNEDFWDDENLKIKLD